MNSKPKEIIINMMKTLEHAKDNLSHEDLKMVVLEVSYLVPLFLDDI